MGSVILELLGAGGIIMVTAFFVDALEKALGKRGLFGDIGKMMKDAGAGVGKLISGGIPGSKVEPELAEIFKHVEDWEDKFSSALIDKLKSSDDEDKK